MHRLIGIFALLMLLAPSSPAADRASRRDAQDVSVISLIANPAKYHRKYVNVMGVAYFDSAHYINAIFLTREDKRKGNSSNAVFIYFAPSIGNADKLNDKFVVVQGIFRADVRGHLNVFPSGLTNASNHAMERTADRRMTRLKEELEIMKQAKRALVRRRSSCSR
jgi:hypothetical protein